MPTRRDLLKAAQEDSFAGRVWPPMTEAQVEALEKLYPARCLEHRETVEDHLRYAGAVDLIAELRARLPVKPTAITITSEEEALLAQDEMAIEVAENTQKNDDKQ